MKLQMFIPSTIESHQAASLSAVVVFTDTDGGDAVRFDDLWVFASIINEATGSIQEDNVLNGRRADSIHPMQNSVACSGGGQIAYSSFPELRIMTLGKFRFQFSAIDMRSHAEGDTISTSGRVRLSVKSEAFEVVKHVEYREQGMVLQPSAGLQTDELQGGYKKPQHHKATI